jgi:thiamine transporter
LRLRVNVLSSDPLNLLVNASVGMWVGDIKQCGPSYAVQHCFFLFSRFTLSMRHAGFKVRFQAVSENRRGKRIMGQSQKKTLFLVEVAVFTALAYLLDLVSAFIFSRIWPQGGSVSLAMVPVFLMAFRWGIKGGILTGFLLGLLQFILGFSQVFHPVQGIIDYFVAFSVIGLAGAFAGQVKQGLAENNKGKWILFVTIGALIGSLLRFLCHFSAGIVFFGSYAPKGQPVALYSLLYNGTYMLPSFILSVIILILVISAAPKKMI